MLPSVGRRRPVETPKLQPPSSLGIPPELWEQTPVAVQMIVIALHERVLQLEERVLQQQERICELEARLNQNSSNSSKPPSSDPPWVNRPKKKSPSGKKPGGQEGHPGSTRELLSADEVDAIVDHAPDHCERCGHALIVGNGPDPVRHQVVELPEVKATVTEHRLHACRCERCGATTRARWPEGVASSAFGPRLQAEIALLTGRYRMSRREVMDYAAQVWGVKLSLGSIVGIERRIAAALAAPYAEAWEALRRASVRNVDETGWREGSSRSWLWVAVSDEATGFAIAAKRGSEVLHGLFGESLRSGYFGSDRWRAYNVVDMERRGICHAHLKRDFVKIQERGGYAGLLGWCLQRVHSAIFELLSRRRSGAIKEALFQSELDPLKARLHVHLENGTRCSDKKVRGMCGDILRHGPALWNFAAVPGLEPTNNVAERALRKAVIWRTGSFGTHRPSGSRFVERMLTVTETCKQHGRRLIDFLAQSISAAIFNQPQPTLLPRPAT